MIITINRIIIVPIRFLLNGYRNCPKTDYNVVIFEVEFTKVSNKLINKCCTIKTSVCQGYNGQENKTSYEKHPIRD